MEDASRSAAAPIANPPDWSSGAPRISSDTRIAATPNEYRVFVDRVAAREPALAEPVARNLYKLMAYKDEYEVARLLTQPEFERQIRDMWDAAESISYNLHPPLLRTLGLKKKLKLGPWFRVPLRLLARMRGLRGTPFDPFGYAAIRREERALISWYRNLVEELLEGVAPDNLDLAREIASLPDQIRGYEQVKLANVREMKKLAAEKLDLVKQAHRDTAGAGVVIP